MIYLHKIATVVPDASYTQEFAIEFLLNLFKEADEKKKNFLKRIYSNSAIYKRHTVIDDYGKNPNEYKFYPKNEKLLPEPSTKERNDLYIKEANKLSLKAVKELFLTLPEGIKEKITHLITISCTGFSAPGFDFFILKNLRLPKNIDRFHIGFMGCYAAFTGMKLAKEICVANKDAKVLMVNVELCSLHFQQNLQPDIVVANAIFADGISACLISSDINDSEGEKLVLHSFLSTYLPNSEDDMSWKIGEHGFDMRLSTYVPKIIDENIKSVLDLIFKKSNCKKEDIKIWAIHPGGKAILEKLEKTLEITKEDLKHSYDILWEYGNMSSTTIMFVLDRIMKDKLKKGLIFALAFGPGLTVESAIMEKI